MRSMFPDKGAFHVTRFYVEQVNAPSTKKPKAGAGVGALLWIDDIQTRSALSD